MNIFESLFFLIYRFVWTPLVLTLLFIISPFHKKIRDGWNERKNSFNKANILKTLAGRQPILIHASSGEFEYAKPVIREMKRKHPEIPIVVTYFSPSYAKAIRQEPGVDIALPLPLDLPTPIHGFLLTLNPRMILIARTDLWPEFINQANRLKIPTLLFSCTTRPLKGFKKILSPYFHWLYGKLTQIYCVDETDLLSLQKMAPTAQSRVYGDTRYDQVIYRLQHPKPHKSDLFKDIHPPILVAGSTWPEDEKILIPAIAELLKKQQLRLVIAPHEPNVEHLSQLEERFLQAQISTTRYSAATTWETPVLLIDQVGHLAEIYSHAHIAFVGGSYRKKVHSVMEPLAAGLPVFVGPYHTNNREALQFQHISTDVLPSLVRCAQNEKEFHHILTETIQTLESNPKTQEAIKNEVNKKSGATKHILEWIDTQLNKENT